MDIPRPARESIDRRQRLVALAFVTALVVVGAVATPFVKASLYPLPGYMLAFGTTMVVTNAILASLLLSRGKAEGDGSVSLLGATYLFVGLIFLPMTAAFPGALTPGALIGTTYSAIWIWTAWHAGFGIGIVACSARRSSALRLSPAGAFCIVAALAAGLAAAATLGVESLPQIFGDPMKGMFSGRGQFVGWSLLGIDGLALAATLRRAKESQERMWLAVAMVAACFDVWLTFQAGARFSVGWYLGKVGSLATTMVVLVALVNHVSALYRQSRAANEALASLAKLDGLTGVANRRGFDEAFEAECRRAARNGHELSLLMIDVDFFKAYNDRNGHQAGDEALRAVAAVIAGCIRRPGDVAARYGGEEFAVVLPQTDCQGALVFARRISDGLATIALPHQDSPSGFVTVSIGVACGRGEHSAVLVRRADQALYAAKREGRNCARVADSWLPSESLAPEAEAQATAVA
jgi:diguanylate cyclase (GGDEF)-like protein